LGLKEWEGWSGGEQESGREGTGQKKLLPMIEDLFGSDGCAVAIPVRVIEEI
jgi:hypothetical protein